MDVGTEAWDGPQSPAHQQHAAPAGILMNGCATDPEYNVFYSGPADIGYVCCFQPKRSNMAHLATPVHHKGPCALCLLKLLQQPSHANPPDRGDAST
jgi:hypothetical protein